MRQLTQQMVEALVDQPEDVNVKEIQGEKTLVLEVSVAKSDLGKIIGKKGRTANALRTIINAAASKNKTRTMIEILE